MAAFGFCGFFFNDGFYFHHCILNGYGFFLKIYSRPFQAQKLDRKSVV